MIKVSMVLFWMLLGDSLAGLCVFAGDPGSESEAAACRQAKIVDMKGSVDVKKDSNGGWQAAQVGIILHQDASVRTGEKSGAELVLSRTEAGEESARITLASNTEVLIGRLEMNRATGAEKTRLDVTVGKVLIKAKELKGDSEFDVKTPTAVAGVWGTEFVVTVSQPDGVK